MAKHNLAIQLYSVREELARDFRGTLQALSRIGFRGVELAYFYGEQEPEELAETLAELQLQPCGIYESISNLVQPDTKVYQYAEKLNCQYLTMGFGLKELEENFELCHKNLQKAIAVAASHKCKVCYHAHAHEFKVPAGASGSYLDRLLQETPGLLYEADTAWIQAGGAPLVAHLHQYAEIIPLLHLKDLDSRGKITELGNGIVDFPAVLAHLDARVQYMSYEQDYSSLGALKSAEISFQYITGLLQKLPG